MGRFTPPTRVAIDTNLLVSLFLDDLPEFAENTEGIFQDPNYSVFLPTYVGVETIAIKSMRGGATSPPISNEMIDDAKRFLANCGAMWVELDPQAMRTAQRLATEFMIDSPDAAILASAMQAECEYLFTNDQTLIKRAKAVKGIEVCTPPRPSQLPIDFTS